ncbi:MAG TPA: 50S ribosomal protein L4 [Tepidisphaeraceae bacterium]|nr:50S ribosomal protein L4 [Tepidisphaeraceae bacterium]
MIQVPVYNQSGKEIEKLSIDPEKLGGKINNALLKQAVVYYQAAQRQGTHQTLARGEVEGSTRKIYKQKGTGNARQGSIRQPVRVGGGHAKQKRPVDHRLDMNVKSRRLARDNALLAKLQAGEVKVVSGVELKQPKTKLMAEVVKALGIDRSCVLALPEHDANMYRAARNIHRMTVTTVGQLNAWDILKNRKVLITKDGLNKLVG